jgi:hypothetical protein
MLRFLLVYEKRILRPLEGKGFVELARAVWLWHSCIRVPLATDFASRWPQQILQNVQWPAGIDSMLQFSDQEEVIIEG